MRDAARERLALVCPQVRLKDFLNKVDIALYPRCPENQDGEVVIVSALQVCLTAPDLPLDALDNDVDVNRAGVRDGKYVTVYSVALPMMRQAA